MTRKFILHIGPAKTGTSSLQEALFQHRDQLLDHGYDYPEFGRHDKMPNLPGHHGLPDLLTRESALPEDVVNGLSEIQSDRTVILSSENFTQLRSEQIAALVEALQPAQIEVVYYTRSWDQLLPSVWQEIVKHGDRRPYLEFLNQQISAPMASTYLNYAAILDRWSQVVGTSNIRVFSYNTVIAGGQDIVQHFCQQMLDLSLDTVASRQDNPSQRPARTETLRQLNSLYFKDRPQGPYVRNQLNKNLQLVEDDLQHLEALYKPYMAKARLCAPFVFQHVERPFLRKYGACVENLSTEGRLFQDNTLVPTPYVRQDYLMEPGVPELFRQLLSNLGL